ncbi:hypothetical protein LIER_09714 [Lithospermum erythrorhizon]|uniref:Uncharacterized protein n=1 Tax=Lithospermum erythrorhizon TaxID=34254 RepID=A0AAV3PHX2_LITER
MRLPFFSFLNYFLITISRAPGQLNPIGGWLNVTIFEVTCRIAGVEPFVSLFSALFTVTHEDFQTTFRARLHRNILAGKRPNKDGARSLSICTDADIRAVDKIRSALPQEKETTHRFPWYTFVEEAILVLADELMIITSARQMEEVDFDAMLGERPSFFDRVKITSKVKPRESMVPPDFAPAAPLPSSSVVVPQVRPILKRIASEFPTTTSKPPKKAKKAVLSKKPSKVMARDSEEVETHSQGVGSQVGPVIPKATSPAIVVEVTSSDTLSDLMANHLADLNEGHLSLREELNAHFPPKAPSPTPIALPPIAAPEEEILTVWHREGKAHMLAYDGKYLETPFQIPNLKVSLDSPWNARKFHYHLNRPLFSNKMAAQYKPLIDPYAALAQSMKHVVQELEALKATTEERAKRLEDLSVELAKEKEVAQEAEKSWVAEKADLISERDASQIRYKELEQARAADSLRVTEALNQANQDRDATLASIAASRNLVTQKIREFLNSSKDEAKIRSECAAYLATLALDHKDKFSDLITLFNEEKARKPDWYGDLSINSPGSRQPSRCRSRRGGGQICRRLLDHFIS